MTRYTPLTIKESYANDWLRTKGWKVKVDVSQSTRWQGWVDPKTGKLTDLQNAVELQMIRESK